jgi:hypothetical protein
MMDSVVVNAALATQCTAQAIDTDMPAESTRFAEDLEFAVYKTRWRKWELVAEVSARRQYTLNTHRLDRSAFSADCQNLPVNGTAGVFQLRIDLRGHGNVSSVDCRICLSEGSGDMVPLTVHRKVHYAGVQLARSWNVPISLTLLPAALRA